MSQIKYLGKNWLDVGAGEFVGSTIGKGIVGNVGNNLARQLIQAGFPSDRENVRFISASRNITKRYLASLATRHALDATSTLIKYPKQSRRAKELQQRIEDMEKMKYEALTSSQSHELISENKAIDNEQKPINKYTGEEMKFALQIKLPDDVPELIKVQNNQKSGQSMAQPDVFVDGTAIVDTNSSKNVILTTVQGRDTSRKEYISGGDLKITVKGNIDSRYADTYPKEAVANFIYLMEYAGVLEVKHYLLETHNITHILVTDYSLSPREGMVNIQPYSFSAVAIAPSKKIEYKLLEQEIVNANAITVNGWVSNAKLGTKKDKLEKVIKWTEKWL